MQLNSKDAINGDMGIKFVSSIVSMGKRRRVIYVPTDELKNVELLTHRKVLVCIQPIIK